MSDPIDVSKWMPAIKRISQQQLPLAELREELHREREATADLLHEIRDISTSLTINAVSTGSWLTDLAARMERALTKYKEQTNENEQSLQGENCDEGTRPV